MLHDANDYTRWSQLNLATVNQSASHLEHRWMCSVWPAGWVFHMPCIHLWWHQSFQNFEKLLKRVSNMDAMMPIRRLQFLPYRWGWLDLNIHDEATLRLKPPRSDVHFISSLLGKQVSKDTWEFEMFRWQTDTDPHALCTLQLCCTGAVWSCLLARFGALENKLGKRLASKPEKSHRCDFPRPWWG